MRAYLHRVICTTSHEQRLTDDPFDPSDDSLVSVPNQMQQLHIAL